jgi:hypothetical protein
MFDDCVLGGCLKYYDDNTKWVAEIPAWQQGFLLSGTVM